MPAELTFADAAAAEYDRAFAHVTAYFMPFLLRAARLAPGIRVLDIATGTGLSAEAALAAVGPTGHVAAADTSPAMVRKARERFGRASNVLLSVEDGQALSFPDQSFDTVLCNLGLMFFPDPRPCHRRSIRSPADRWRARAAGLARPRRPQPRRPRRGQRGSAEQQCGDRRQIAPVPGEAVF